LIPQEAPFTRSSFYYSLANIKFFLDQILLSNCGLSTNWSLAQPSLSDHTVDWANVS